MWYGPQAHQIAWQSDPTLQPSPAATTHTHHVEITFETFPNLWWHHYMETFSPLLALYGEIHHVDPPHKGPVMWSFDVFFVVSPICRWLPEPTIPLSGSLMGIVLYIFTKDNKGFRGLNSGPFISCNMNNLHHKQSRWFCDSGYQPFQHQPASNIANDEWCQR